MCAINFIIFYCRVEIQYATILWKPISLFLTSFLWYERHRQRSLRPPDFLLFISVFLFRFCYEFFLSGFFCVFSDILNPKIPYFFLYDPILRRNYMFRSRKKIIPKENIPQYKCSDCLFIKISFEFWIWSQGYSF
jgi:hypothetical protein